MRTLLLHDVSPDAPVAAALEAAGHAVVRCTEPGAPGFPCRAEHGSCPLDGTVDVAVVVHDRPSTDFAPGEAGVICARRDGIPLVVAGNHAFSLFAEVADAVAADAADVPAACERAVAASAGRAATEIGAKVGTEVAVERRGDVVTVTLPADSTERTAVLAHQAASRRFPHARLIGVNRR